MRAPSTYEVDRYEDGQNQKGKWDEDLEQCSQVAEEEVSIETAFLDEIRVGGAEHRYDPTPKARRRCSYSFSFWYQVGLWRTAGSISMMCIVKGL